MKKVITYGTYDLLHYGHIRLLERAKALGNYLIVGVTAEDFDKVRGKINVKQSLMERVEAVRQTGLADKIVIEEYEGQKIDDIRRYDVDIFTVGSDWIGKFDYLREYCEVIYLDRTEGVSSTEIRATQNDLRMGLVGESTILNKVARESKYINGLTISSVYTKDDSQLSDSLRTIAGQTGDYDALLENVDMVYLASHPDKHYEQIKHALLAGKHVICESPITSSEEQNRELFALAKERNCILMDAIKTAYSTAYSRLLLLAKGGNIGNVVSVDATCTSLQNLDQMKDVENKTAWNSICEWGPTALLPVFQLLGTQYSHKNIVTSFLREDSNMDLFTKIDFIFDHAVATIKVGKGVKSEGELIISGTEGYIYVPAPWWKTDYFEIRYENSTDNKRYFYQLDGEGIRYELVAFVKSIEKRKEQSYIEQPVTNAISKVIEDFDARIDMQQIKGVMR